MGSTERFSTKNRKPIPICLAKLRHQRHWYRHIDTLSVINVPEMESFIGYWQGVLLENAMQRAGFMYGYYLEDKNYDEGTRAIMEVLEGDAPLSEPTEQEATYDSIVRR
ncbi:hypothetical protein AK812_SmicGene12689 [Symbiodinium microadriaticum]|uniref:Uncharacterized protein n=1 Tax=Symbiodinium microadriaticum TaxID=2951 RepID=A0A1Q9EA25_SYMMI|nr:hypothetical protein AK812_SmicGene12689 [Symbiodinium microadriaticum]